jgi:hypothetical protein
MAYLRLINFSAVFRILAGPATATLHAPQPKSEETKMAKDFLFFKGELPPSRDKYHAVIRGNLFILFDKNQSAIQAGHDKVIREKVVDFLVRAVRALGKDEYNLSVLGMASATGPRDFNRDLAGQRAYNSAMCAIRHFEKLQKTDPTLAGSTINPVTQVLGDDLARLDARVLGMTKGNQIERQQGIFRSAVFKFSAGRLEPHEKRPPSFVCTGPEASRRARELLNTPEPEMAPFPTPWGPVQVKKGQIWGPTKRLIVSADWQHVTYLEDNTLWSTPTADFAREIMLDGMAEGMHRAKPLVAVTKVVMSFIQGVLVGPLEAIAAKLIVLFMWGGAHPDLVKAGYEACGPAFRGLKFIHDRCPTLWMKLMEKAKEEAGKNIVEALEETATNPENIAFLLGRILRGVGGLDKLFLGKASPAKTMAEVTLGKIAFVTVECAILVAALHLPEGFLAVTEKSIAQLAKDLQKSFATKEKIQIILDDPVAKKIAGEILQPGVKAELEKLDKPLNDLKKTIDNYIEETKDLE